MFFHLKMEAKMEEGEEMDDSSDDEEEMLDEE